MSHSFPTIEEILAMHADLIAQFGGSSRFASRRLESRSETA